MNLKIKFSILISLILVICIICGTASACFSLNGSTILRLNKEKVTLRVGESCTLTAETDGAGIIWSSDATHIATVDGGVITAVAAGETIVKARVGKMRAFCDVKVLDPVRDPEKSPVLEGYICDLYADYFVIGAAVQSSKLMSDGYAGLTEHFNSITPENNMKWKNIEKSEGVFDFDQKGDSSDKLISWAKQNGTGVRGHCLLWYKSLPKWLHEKFYGWDCDEILKRKTYSYIDDHIETVMEYFGNDVYVWDVVNEALANSVSANSLTVTADYPYGKIWRNKDNTDFANADMVDWYEVCGSYEYIARASKKADEVRKAMGLDVELFYNDYSLNNPNKRQACLNLIRMLRDENAPIDGIGMQAHYKLEDYVLNKNKWIDDFETSVKTFIEVGVDVQITELDIRFNGGLTEENEQQQAEMYGKIFDICRKYAKTDGVEHGITGVTFWGIHDGSNGAWGEEAYPLIFGTDKLPKKAYYEIISF